MRKGFVKRLEFAFYWAFKSSLESLIVLYSYNVRSASPTLWWDKFPTVLVV